MLRSVAALVLLVVVSCSGGPRPRSAADEDGPTAPPLPWTATAPAPPAVASPLVALVGGTVMTATGPALEDGVVLFANGRIVAVGSADEVEVPDGAERVDVRGRYVTPGIIDTHSHMGVYAVPRVRATSDGNEATSPTTPEVRAADAVWPQDPALARALAAGVTTIHVLPGSANLIGGAGVTLKLHLGRTVSELAFPGAPETLKMACGENPKRVYGGRNAAPSTRMGNVAGYRAAFLSAREYGDAWARWQAEHLVWQGQREDHQRTGEGDEPGPAPAPPDRDLGLERLLGVLDGRVLVQMHCYRADEMVRMIEVGDELGFQVRAFHHAVEAYKIPDHLAARGIAIATWADWWGFKLEAYDAIEENLALLTRAGARGVLHSDSPMLVQRLPQEAAKAMAAGHRAGIEVSEHEALRWITANAAWVLGIDEETGTLAPGRMADVVVWSGHPFSVYTRADRVYVDGLLAFDRSDPATQHQTDFEVGQDLELRLPEARP
ncbi:MAG: amidohydrolase [Sandaracinaceae bacterium]